MKKKWSHELKRTTTATKTELAKVRTQLKTIGTLELNAFVMLPWRFLLGDKLSILFESCHARQMHSHFQYENRWNNELFAMVLSIT